MNTPTQVRTIFDRVVVGVDGSEAGFEACRQVARIASTDAVVEAAAVVHLGPEVAAVYRASEIVDRLQIEADEALARALRILGPRASKRYLDGFVTAALIGELEHFDATLLAIGTHGHHRATEILVGGPAGELLHRSPCSVLVARPVDAETFPHAIVVGHDASPQADAALDAAEQLARRFGSTLSVVTAPPGGAPVDALVEAGRDADLLVVGSRGLHGLEALASVSERVAHRAGCSVLVVRTLTQQEVEGERANA